MESKFGNASFLRLNAVTRAERLATTAKIRELIVVECHGWVGDFYQYSNAAICLHFELSARAIPVLLDALRHAGVVLGAELNSAAHALLNMKSEAEITQCTLHLTFIHNEPDLRRQIPAVPG